MSKIRKNAFFRIRNLKWVQHPKFHVVWRNKAFLFCIKLWCVFIDSIETLHSIIFRRISSIYYGFRDKINRKGPKRTKFPNRERERERERERDLEDSFWCLLFLSFKCIYEWSLLFIVLSQWITDFTRICIWKIDIKDIFIFRTSYKITHT